MDLGAILLALSLVILVGAFVLRPVLQPSPGGTAPGSGRLSELLAERERILDALREVDLDHTLGKLLLQDYRAQRQALARRGAEVLRQIDEAGGLGPASPTIRDSAALEAELEAAVRRRRSRRPTDGPADRFCGRCGAGLQTDDRFCVHCGAPVPGASSPSAGAV